LLLFLPENGHIDDIYIVEDSSVAFDYFTFYAILLMTSKFA